ncbi:MAG: lipid-A-disaccharide synthase, partial [Saprospiraceae bacterium]|nr:lipid-A-disaccharide synthase [Saprospiraceae bacterium]
IVDRPLVRELIQNDLNTSNLRTELTAILDPAKATELQAGYAEVRHLLGDGGASGRAAAVILEAIRRQG